LPLKTVIQIRKIALVSAYYGSPILVFCIGIPRDGDPTLECCDLSQLQVQGWANLELMNRTNVLPLICLASAVGLLRWKAGVSWIIAYVLAISGTTLLAYAYDKWAAGRSRSRIPERTLHALAIAGGSPAALICQRVFRHKTMKASFRLWFWIIVVVQTLGLAAWFYYRHM
jgi:uncharacterized membrane protein YsdA (DUF1294 family)